MSSSTQNTHSPVISVDGISRSFGDHHVLTDVTFSVHSGARAGLIGQNGSGKTTLLRILAGEDEPDAGAVHVPAGSTVALLHQDSPITPSMGVDAAAAEAQSPQRAAIRAVEEASAAMESIDEGEAAALALERALALADRTDAWTMDADRERVLAGLGLGGVDPSREVRTLSGGQLSRLRLARLLLSRPDILLLDEPTNHLDDGAAAFLASLLEGWRGPVIAASHDRAFLDDVATEILDLDPAPSGLEGAASAPASSISDRNVRGLTRTRGRYTDHLMARLDEREAWERRYSAEQAELKRLRAQARDSHTVGHLGREPRTEARASKKFYSDKNARVVKRRVDDATRRFEELEASQVRKPPKELVFRGLGASGREPRGDASLLARDVAVAGRLAPVTFDLRAGDQLLVTGANGSGKSTLLAVLAGELEATGGSWSATGRVGLMAQNPRGFAADATVREAYAAAVGAAVAAEVPVETFGLLHPRDLSRPVGELSTGTLRRLDLAIELADPPEVLALDEPTNHLSLDVVTALEDALPGYPGIVIVASHDRWLRRRWGANGGRQLELAGGGG